MTDRRARILVVDDLPDNVAVVRARLESLDYEVLEASDGESALSTIKRELPDLVLLDVMMPGLDGIETVRRLKRDSSLPFIPVILLTSRSDVKDVVAGLDAGADEYLAKPLDHAALVARIRAMLRIKALQDRIADQSRELAQWNGQLTARVAAQVDEIERVSRLKRFLSPQIVDLLLSSPAAERALDSHRADISVLFADIRGFTAFAETAEPEDVMRLLTEFHGMVGEEVDLRDGTLERFAGDAVMIFFNDPIACADHMQRAVELGLAIRARAMELSAGWKRRGAELGVGVGIASGYATLGRIGFEKRSDYAAIGTVTNLASRLCGEARSGQVLVSARVAEACRERFAFNDLGEIALKGFSRPTLIYETQHQA